MELTKWTEGQADTSGATWSDQQRRSIKLCVNIKVGTLERAITATVQRKAAPAAAGQQRRTLDTREYDICNRIAERISQVLSTEAIRGSSEALDDIASRFVDNIVAAHLQTHHGFVKPVADVFEALRQLSGQTYENNALSFGCILDPNDSTKSDFRFPKDFFKFKKYKALTDGFRTGFVLSSSGSLSRFIDFEHDRTNSPVSNRHMFPEWAAEIARHSQSGTCGVCLTRAGDVLVFDEGTLRFAYRFGRWRYFNHNHIVNLLMNVARVQRVPPSNVGRVVKSIYRAALDVSFRRSGGLFVLLKSRNNLRSVVRAGDAMGDARRPGVDSQLDSALPGTSIHGLPRRIVSELAGLDGAVILDNTGALMAYGAILQPKKRGHLSGTEGSRTKAAIGASNYGLAIKISADGDISAYRDGKLLISV